MRCLILLSISLFILSLITPSVSAEGKDVLLKADLKALNGVIFEQKQDIKVLSKKSVGKLVRQYDYKLTVNEKFEHADIQLDENGALKSFERYYDKARRDYTENSKTVENEVCSFEINFVRFRFTPDGVVTTSDDETMSKEDSAALAKEIHPEFLLPGKEISPDQSWDFNNQGILAGFDLDPKQMLTESNSAKATFKKMEGDLALIDIDMAFQAKPNEKSKLMYQLQMSGSIRFNVKTGIVEDFRYGGEYGMKSQGSEGPNIEHIISFSGERIKK